MGFSIGLRFSHQIKNRVANDLILQNQLIPFAQAPQSHSLLLSLFHNNRSEFPTYWDELLGTAQGSGVPLLHDFIYYSLTLGRRFLLLFPKGLTVLTWIPPMTALMLLFLVNLWPLQPTMRMQTLHCLAIRIHADRTQCPMEDEIVAGGIGRNFVSRHS